MRPGLQILAVDQRMFANQLVNTFDLTLGTALFQKIAVRDTKPPIKSKETATIPSAFHAMTVRSNGAIASRRLVEHAALNKNRPYRELMQTLAGYFEEGNTRISLRADMGEIKIGIVWQALGKTAGVALIYTPEHEQTPEGVALLLTGLDKQDDRAALEAYGKRIEDTRMAAILLQNLRAIGDDARPLAVRFLTDNVALPKIADEIAWCVAAAFFKHKDVL